jgi:hypothetical protein
MGKETEQGFCVYIHIYTYICIYIYKVAYTLSVPILFALTDQIPAKITAEISSRHSAVIMLCALLGHALWRRHKMAQGT